MIENEVFAQAGELTALISRLLRTLYTLEAGDLAIELPAAQMRACIVIMEEPRTITSLSKELGISASAATQLADRLEKAGLVERFAGIDDHRVKLLRLTGHGVEVIGARRARRIERTARALHAMSCEDRQLVIHYIQKLYESGKATNQEFIEDSLGAADTPLD